MPKLPTRRQTIIKETAMPTSPSKLAIKQATAIIDTLPEWMRDEEALHDLVLAMVTARIAEEAEQRKQ